MMRALTLSAVVLMACSAEAVELGTDGTRFTLDGRPAFLLGVSYYAGLGRSPELMATDLDDLRVHGVNWLRVWATWTRHNTGAAVNANGEAEPEGMARLKQLVRLAEERGMVIDVTLHRGGLLTTQQDHLAAVRTLARELKPWRNLYIDTANERNIRDARYVPMEECAQLRDAIKQIDPTRLVTASHAGGVMGREALEEYLREAKMDILTPHLPRGPEDPAKTEARVRQYLEWMREIGRSAPVHLQEPFRRDYGSWQPDADDFLTDLRGAIAGGAAGWCLHNGDVRSPTSPKDGEPRRSFDLSPDRGPFIGLLDATERDVLARMGALVER